MKRSKKGPASSGRLPTPPSSRPLTGPVAGPPTRPGPPPSRPRASAFVSDGVGLSADLRSDRRSAPGAGTLGGATLLERVDDAAATRAPAQGAPFAAKVPAPRATLTHPKVALDPDSTRDLRAQSREDDDALPTASASSKASATCAEDPVTPAPERSSPEVVEAKIRALEAHLDRLIDEASRRDLSSLDAVSADTERELGATRKSETLAGAHAAGPGAPSETFGGPSPRPSAARPFVPPPEPTVFDTARELLSTDFYLRKWGRLAMRNRSEEVDPFGYDPLYDEKYRPLLEFLYRWYFRVECTGIENVPATGRCLLVANHSGTVPLDGVMIKTALKLEHPAQRHVRWLTEDFIYHFPYLGSMMNRLGAVRACQQNAERLLEGQELVAVFPEGVKGIGKLFSSRYQLQRFGRGGFIKLCLRTGTPIVPVAVVGAEETNPLLFRIEYLSKALGLPYVPVTPTFPLLGPAGLLPAPTKWSMTFGEPIDVSAHGPDAADDDLLVGKLADRVRGTIQGMLDRGVVARKSVFFG